MIIVVDEWFNSLKVPNHESYTQRRAPPRGRLLTSRRSAPYLLALGFNAAIPDASRVAEYPPPVSRVMEILKGVVMCQQP